MTDFGTISQAAQTTLDESLGYLNFSSGAADPRFLKGFNELFGLAGGLSPQGKPWKALHGLLVDRLAVLWGQSPAFADTTQAEAVLALAFDHVLPAYRHYHSDLLQHQSDGALFQPFFLARVCSAVVRHGPPWEEKNRIVAGVVDELNDFLGYRPVAVLHTPQKIEPYPHEWVAPLPLFVR
ncbi:MAG TPA: hypothetical protein VHY20_06285, partial [Pirellulales bacterium]|nr:hypothetical protein [Pirellulales bacterium]